MPKESIWNDVTAAAVGAIIGGVIGQPVVGAMVAAPLSKYAQDFVQRKYDVLGSDVPAIGGFQVIGNRSG